MSFFSRTFDVVSGMAGIAVAPVGFVKDVVFEAAGITDNDEYEGVIGTLWHAGIDRAGDAAAGAFGPDSGLGALAGAIPGSVRNPPARVFNATMEGFEDVYGFTSRVASTAVTAASLSDRDRGDMLGFGGLFEGDTWRDAWKIAADRSPGQAVSLAFGTRDILDAKEVNEYAATDMYEISSGLWDAAFRFSIISPDIALGRAGSLARTKYLVRPIKTVEQTNNYFRGAHWSKVDNFIAKEKEAGRGASARVSDRLFKDHGQRDLISHYLTAAKDSNDREKVMRFLMGDFDQIDALYGTDEFLALQLEEVTQNRALIRSAQEADGTLFADEFALANAPHRLKVLDREVSRLQGLAADRARLVHGKGAIGNETRLGVKAGISDGILRSDFYQTSPFMKPVRTFTNMRPHRIIDLHRENASIQVDRNLREAGMDQYRRDIWRERIDAASPEQRGALIAAAENAALRTKAKQYGLSKQELNDIIAAANTQRQEALGFVQQAKYGPDDLKAQLNVRDPDGEDFSMPVFLTQTANAGVMVDFWKVDRLLREAGEFKYRLKHGPDSKVLDWTDKAVGASIRSTVLPREAITSVMKAWKPAVLLRPAWTMRVVVLDEQFRKIAKIGALANAFDMMQGGRNLIAANMRTIFGEDGDGWMNKLGATRGIGGMGAGVGMVAAGPAGAVLGGIGGAAAGRALSKVKEAPYKQLTINGHKVMSAFGAPDDAESVWRSIVSANESTRELLNVHENGILERLHRSGGWETKYAGQKGYNEDWERIVNDQILGDQMARQFVEGKTADEVKDWLVGSAEGAAYRKKLARRKDVDAWVETAGAMVDHFIPDVGDLRAKGLSDKRVKHADLDALVPASQQPSVHAQMVEQILGKSAVNKSINDIVNRWFNILGTLPTDHLSRNPYFARVYEAEMRRRLSGDASKIKPADLRRIEDGARNVALKETRDLLYDFAERSEFADLMRNVIPFFPAFQEVLTRWAGLAVENPVFAARALKTLGAPANLPADGVNLFGVEASWYTDQDDNGFLQFRIPEWAKGLVNHGLLKSAVDSQGYVRFDPKSFSMVGSGTPGFGPFVQVAMSEVVKARPELEDSVKFMLPYGVQGEWVDVFLPATGKRIKSLAGEDENRAYANAYYRIITTKMTEMREGKIAYVDMNDPVARGKFLGEVKDETDKFFHLRTIAAWVSPVTPMFDSPYQAQIDAYRERKLIDPEHADDWFLENFGEEFFSLTQSFTKSTNGIPPTLTGLDVEKKYKDLITRYPEFGALIAGAEGSGLTDKFSRAVYDRQLSSETVPGSGINQRERFSAEQIVQNPDVRLAWSKFGRAMDAIESVRLQRGLPNLRVRGAEDLAEAKRQFINNLATEHPAWADEYFDVDLDAWQRKIEGLRAVAATPGLNERPAIDGLRKYLEIREQFLAALAVRESQDISATSNMDLAFAWDSAVARLASEPAFGDLYARWLDNDRLDPETRSAA